MNRNKFLTLAIAIFLLPAMIAGFTQTAAASGQNSSIPNSTLPEGLHSIPGANIEWWAAVQRDLPQSRDVTMQTSWQTILAIIPNWFAESNQIEAFFGYSVGTAGDVNGDGYDDVIVGAPDYDLGEIDEGAAAVYYGSASGLSLVYNWLGEGGQEGAYYGATAGTAGDVNGDGYSDIIIGAPGYDHGQISEGAAVVYYGSSSGLSLIPDWFSESNKADTSYGISVSTAGDVNGDGFDDVIVGADWYSNGQHREGGAAVYHGSAGGLPLTPNWLVESDVEHAEFGYSVSTAGDVNGDGYDDVIIGAHLYMNGEEDEGAAVVYLGSSAGLFPTPSWGKEGDQTYAEFGWSVATAGDVNGDGYDDVIVGAPYYNHGQIFEGMAWVYQGSASGLSLVPEWSGESNQEGAQLGYAVNTAGDVNSDGFDDVIVGAIRYSHGQFCEGVAGIYLGTGGGLSHFPNWLLESDLENAEFGSAVGTAGDVNGDGFDDIIVGDFRYTHGENEEGAAAVYHGIGEQPYQYIFIPVTLRNP